MNRRSPSRWFLQSDRASARQTWRHVADQLRPRWPKLGKLMDDGDDDVLAYAAQETLFKRLVALAGSHDLLTCGGWDGACLTDIVQRALSAYGGQGRVEATGPPVRLAADAVEVVGLVLHELATNAAKHGALSAPEGRVVMSWILRRAAQGSRVVEIDWRQCGGPPVTPPRHQGFGTRLLERGLTQKLGGTVKFDFRPAGMECRICLPVVVEGRGRASRDH